MSKERVSLLDISAGRMALHNAVMALVGFVVIGLGYMILKPWLGVGYDFTAPWDSHGNLGDGLSSVWFIFLWGAGVNLLMGLRAIIQRTPTAIGPGEVFNKGTALSFVAGFFEEIIYRWLALFGSMIVIRTLNYFPFFGLLGWLYREFLIPLTNWASFGLLEPQLYGSYGWLFAAGIVSANMRFQSGHEYQGFFGWVNAWYMGLFLFYLMFNYGLWTAIVAHILYNLCIFWMRGIMVRFSADDLQQTAPASVLTTPLKHIRRTPTIPLREAVGVRLLDRILSNLSIVSSITLATAEAASTPYHKTPNT